MSYHLGVLSVFGFIICCFVWFNNIAYPIEFYGPLNRINDIIDVYSKLYMTRYNILLMCLQDIVLYQLGGIGIKSNIYYDIFIE